MSVPTSNTLTVLNGAEVGPLIIEPLQRTSVALRTTRVVQTLAESFRLPRITADPTAEWTAPNTQIAFSEAVGDEITIVPAKVAGISAIANELADDSDPAAAGIIGEGLARDIGRKIDRALFGAYITDDEDPDYNAVRPKGLEAILTADLAYVDADPAASLDAFVDGIAAADDAETTIDHWVTTPAVKKALRKLKTGTGSNQYLVSSEDGELRVLGAPVIASPHVLTGTAWGIPSNDVFTVIRKDVEVAIDRSARFDYDQTVVRAIVRTAFGFPRAAGLVKIKTT